LPPIAANRRRGRYLKEEPSKGVVEMKDIIVLKGQIVYAESPERLTVRPDACLVAEDGKVVGVYDALPDADAGAHALQRASQIGGGGRFADAALSTDDANHSLDSFPLLPFRRSPFRAP